MKIYISYFYQIRFFRRNMIPLSTAVWDPKWFHQFQSQDHTFKDQNGVYNGLRIEQFMPGKSCDNLCRGPEYCNPPDPKSCLFLRNYRAQLDQLNFDGVMKGFNDLGNYLKQLDGFSGDPIIVLIVHEAPQNPCSERVVIKQWFQDHGYPLLEWHRSFT